MSRRFLVTWPEAFRGRPEPHRTDRQVLDLVLKGVVRIMADLSNLTAALDQLGTDVASAAADVTAKLDELLADIAALEPGNITQDQIDALTAKATAADEAVQAIDTAANGANPPA